MLIDCDHNLIAEWRSLDEVLPYPQYKSGAMDNDNPVYKYGKEKTSNPVLTLEFDILNEAGYGLKKGYYEIGTDPEYSTLQFIEAGYIKAKIPVVKQEVISSAGSDFEWHDDKGKNAPLTASKGIDNEVTVYSRKTYKHPYTDKELKKRKKKYKKGMDPTTYFHSKVYMEYDKELDVYKIIWEKYNTRLIGILKI